MDENIQVAVRILPAQKEEQFHWGCEPGMVVELDPKTREKIGDPYKFKHVFDPEARNSQIFQSVIEPLINSAMEGYNTTILAHGQPDLEKAYTMMGTDNQPGIVQLAIHHIFHLMETSQEERAFLLRCSYFDICKEDVFDLLSVTYCKRKIEERDCHCHVVDLTEKNVNTAEAVLELIVQGDMLRNSNGSEHSPLSIFRIVAESVPLRRAEDYGATVMISEINFVYLAAGREYQSLSALPALRHVINQLSAGEARDSISYEYCKLTRILKSSFGGNVRTAFICHVTSTVFWQTRRNLDFGSKSRTVSNQPQVNHILSQKSLLCKIYKEIKRLDTLRLHCFEGNQSWTREKTDRLINENEEKCRPLKDQLIVANWHILSRQGFYFVETSPEWDLGPTLLNGNHENDTAPAVLPLAPRPLRSGISAEVIDLSSSPLAMRSSGEPTERQTNLQNPGSNGCSGRIGCTQRPKYLFSCPHKKQIQKLCSQCLLRITDDEKCGCDAEDFSEIPPELVQID